MNTHRDTEQELAGTTGSSADSSTGTSISFYGGLGEIGANMCAVETDNHVVVIDCGVMFPDANHPGIDLILPDWTDLKKRGPNVDAVILTHGHEDHIGAVPYFLQEFPHVPVFGSKLTLGLLAEKLKEHDGVTADLREVAAGELVTIARWQAEFVQVNHSIPDALAVALHTQDGVILHTGDFRMDQTPIDGKITDLPHLSQLGDEGVDLLLADSTNACVPGIIKSEKTVGVTLQRVFAQATGRIIVTTFASHIHRVQQIINAAKANERLVVFVGRSMLRNLPIARELGYLDYDDNDVVELSEANSLPTDRLVIICTGSQGEPFAALSLMASGSHKYVDLVEGDTVVMASSQIPGNESAIFKVINGLYRQQVNVVQGSSQGVHVSGHASADELLFFHNIVRPTNFIPIHGEYRHLVEHAALSRNRGTKTVMVCADGDRVILRKGELERAESFGYGRTFVDGDTVGEVGPSILRERNKLATEGVCIVAVRLDASGKVQTPVEIAQMGLFNEQENPELLNECGQYIEAALRPRLHSTKLSVIEHTIYESMSQFWRKQLGRRPVVVPVFLEG